MTREEAQALVKKHGSIRAVARATGLDRDMIARTMKGIPQKAPGRPRGSATAAVPAPGFPSLPKVKVDARSLSEFRNTYDKDTIVPKAVNTALKALGSGWLYEVEFAKLAGLSLKDLGLYRDRYAEHIVVIRDHRCVWVGKATVAEEMRRML